MDGVGGLLLLFLTLLPLLVDRSPTSSCFWEINFCRTYTVTVAVGGDGYLGGTQFDIFL